MAVKIIVLTASTPPVPEKDVEGHYRRLKLFMSAIGTVADHVEIVHIVPESVIAGHPDGAELNSVQSRQWGYPVHVRMVAHRSRDKTFYNHYFRGVVSAAEQPLIQASTGPAQVAAIAGVLAQTCDLVFVHGLPAMCAVLRSGNREAKIVFDLDDVAHRMRIRASLQPPFEPQKLMLLAHAPALLWAERLAASRSRLTFVSSEVDYRKLRGLGFGAGLTLVRNAVSFPRESPSLTREPTLLFIGDFGYGPNLEAGERLATAILPRIRQQVPAARLFLTGKRAARLSQAAVFQPGVECLGFVENLDQLYAQVRLVCCPLRNGGGTRVKLIEGASYGRPLIATQVGAEGLAFVNGSEILLRNDDAGFADACVQLLRDDALCQRLGTAARDRARRIYDSRRVEAQIVGLLQGAIR
jgi:glycosyltransferase involved in cell wall biosynthesis